ncbi:Ubiquitin carboxyl-terminal hydrolase [Mycena venus]|uniref:Ubiquitin carboxyl-terminal hydrolase n=1 Tax=Mycena venus TaxID=2733690 RepID=A0A8H6U1D1_9AGAR|nr:Ubiquitin carboxyl-terminal hydrolase [Mycena venus]
MDEFPITEAQIVALFLESVFWGFYLITFVPCLRLLLFKSSLELKRLSEIKWPMLLVALGICVITTLDVAIGLMHSIQAFALYTGAGGAPEEFSNISHWVNVVKTIDVVLQTLLGDGMLVRV